MDGGPAPPREERPAAAAAPAPLFRREALEARRSRWLGTVLVAPGVPGAVVAGLSLLLAAGVLALLFGADYTRKARITGWLAPEAGMVRVFAPRQGVVVGVHAREGQAVARGAPLLSLSTEVESEGFGAVRAQVVARLRTRLASLEEARALEARLAVEEESGLRRRVATLEREIAALEREAGLQRARLELAERAAARQRGLRTQGLQTEPRLERAEEDRLANAARVHALERDAAALERDRAEAAASLAALPLRRARREAELDRAVAELEGELAEAAAQREIVLAAPAAGTVTAMLAELGSGVAPSTPLLGIVPEGSRLEAQLFAPSRAVGFLRPGQPVLLRYAAFPYQKFGQHEGEVASVSRSTLGPSELPQSLSGVRALAAAGEPLYRITVSLARQEVAAYGQALPLQPGMQLEADVRIERRRLIEWALDPLYTVAGRWRS